MKKLFIRYVRSIAFVAAAIAGLASGPIAAAQTRIGVIGAQASTAVGIAQGQGLNAVLLPNLSAASLAEIDAVWVLNDDNSLQQPALVSNAAAVANFISAGGVLLYHDRQAFTPQSVLPGSANLSVARDLASNIDVINNNLLVTNGPAGVITNSTLDGGSSSAHGYTLVSSLPPGGQGVLSNGNPQRAVDIVYPFGTGFVYYSTIPLDAYLSGTGPIGFSSIYAPNVVRYAAQLAETGPLDPLDVVVIFDTSSSLGDEAANFCADSAALPANLAAAGFAANVKIWGITATAVGAWNCLTSNVRAELGNPVPNGGTLGNDEDWGNAVAIVADRFPWTSSLRVVVPISDEGARNGNPVNPDDHAAIANAVHVCTAKGVIAVGVAASGSSTAVQQNFADLASGTGGTWFLSTNANDGIAGAVLDAIGNILRPDLVVEAGTPLPQYRVGESQTVSWAVRNQGNRDITATWTDRLYLSANGQIAGAIEIGSLAFSGTLPPGDATARQLTVTIPVNAAGPRRLLIVADANANVLESDETNNTLNAGPVNVVGPDLTVTGLTAPASLVLGSTTGVSWTATNAGTSNTLVNWQDRVWLSTDTTIDAGDRLLSSVDRSELLAGESEAVSADLTLPLTTEIVPGVYFLLLQTDATNTVLELVETNNTAAPVGVQIVAPPVPDLVVSSFTAPSSAIAGTQVTVQWSGRNEGTVAAGGPWVDRVYLSTDTSLDGSDTLIDEFGFAGSLGVGQVYTRSFLVNLPNRFGSQHLLLVLDGNDAVEELAGESNNVTALPVTVQPMPIPDLVVAAMVPPANGVLSGSRTEVTFDVRNLGTGPTTVPTWSDELILSTDATLDGGDPVVGTMTNPLFLPVGQNYRQRVQFNLPSDRSGQFWVFARTDRANQVPESNEANNTAVAGPFTVELEPQPDLRVTSVSGPQLAFSGEPLAITWSEINSTALPGTGAPTDVASWSVRFFLSSNQTPSITPGDIQLGTAPSGQASPLAPGASFTVMRSVTLPTIISGDFYIKVETDSSDVVSEFGFEGNNVGVSAQQVTITQTPPVDLVATALTAAGQALPGHVIALSYEAANFGAPPQSAVSWSDAIYLSSDDTLDPATDTRLAVINRSAGASGIDPYAPTVTARLSNSLAPGSYTLFVRVDDRGAIFEGTAGEANNVFRAPSTLVVEARYANFQPALSAPSAEAFPPGRSVDLSWIVTNIGNAVTPVDSWSDSVLFSIDGIVDATDQTLTNAARTGVLPPGAGYNRQASVTMPLVPPGSYFLILVADRANTVFEGPGDTEANASIVPITISNVASDLVASNAAAPSSAVSGGPISVTWTVTNQGLAETNQTTWIDTVEVFSEASPTTVIASATRAREGTLPPSGGYIGTVVVPLPISAQGSFMARVRADSLDRVFEQSEANNESTTASFAVTLPDADGDGQPDIANLVAAPPSGPSTARAGDSISVAWSVFNTGDGTTSTNQWSDTVYLSDDAALSPNDITLGARTRFEALNAGGSYNASINAVLPGSIAAGTYFLIVRADAAGAVFENGLTADNIAVSANPITIEPFAAPNLVAISVSTAPDVATGQLLDITWSARNDGEGPPRETNWSDAVWLSRDQFLGGADIRLGSLNRSGTLAVGETYQQTTSFRVPVGIAGPYFVLVQIDSADRVNELGRESDNIAAGSSLINVTIPDPADLVVDSVSPPSMAMLGEQATFTWQIANAADASLPVTGSWEDSVFLSADSTWDINDAFIGRATTRAVVPLDPGATVMGTLTAAVPGVRPGQYFVIVRADSRNLIPETDDLNNDGVSVGVVNVEATPLTLGVPFTGQFPSGVDRYFQVDVPAGETLRFTYTHDDPNAFTELYVAFERVPTIGDFDAVFDSPGQESQTLTISASSSGTYFVLARSVNVSTLASGTLRAETVPFGIQSVFPTRPGQGLVTFIADGGRLLELTTVEFVSRSTGNAISPVRIGGLSGNQVQFTADLSGAAIGEVFDLVARSISTNAVLSSSIVVEAVRTAKATTSLENVGAIRQRSSRVINLVVANESNIDLGYVEVTVSTFNFGQGTIATSVTDEADNDDDGGLFETGIAAGTTASGSLILERIPPGFRGVIPVRFDLGTGPDDAFQLVVSSDSYSEQSYFADHVAPLLTSLEEYSRTELRAQGYTEAVINEALLAIHGELLSRFFEDGIVAGGESDSSPILVFRVDAGNIVTRLARGKLCSRLTKFLTRGPCALCTRLPGPLPVRAACAIACQGGSFYANRCVCRGCPKPFFCHNRGDCDCPDDVWDNLGNGCRVCRVRYKVIDGQCVAVPCSETEGPCIPTPRAVDPNELAGPTGIDAQRWVRRDELLSYRAFFENLPAASAPASRVRVTLPLPPQTAPGTVRLSNIGFGDLILEVPDNRITLQDSILTNSPQGTPIRVDITAGVNPSSNPPVAFWVLQAIDVATGEPPLDPFDGFLPPNNPETRSGEGYIDFSLRPAPGVVTGDVISLQAEIIFDNEEPILTNTVFNTIDADRPFSMLGPLPAATLNPEIPLSFSGIDPAGSGLLGVQVLVSEDNGPLTVLVPTTQENAAVFEGEPGRVYRFVSQAIDRAGNIEAIAGAPSAVVTVPTINLAAESDTGTAGDGTTRDRTPTIEIVSVPFSAVPITVTGPTSLAGTVFTDAIGRGSYTVPNGSALPDGSYTVATDNAGVVLQSSLRIVSPVSVERWASVATHGTVGPASIPISFNGTTTEPRSTGVSRVEILFNSAVEAASFAAEAVTVSGRDTSNQSVDLSGVTVTTSLAEAGDTASIKFTPALPDEAFYCIALNGVLDAAGHEVTGGTRVRITSLKGDVNGDRRVNGADVAFARAIRGQAVNAPVDPAIQDHVRADAQVNGRMDGADISFIRSFNGNDTRPIGDPCPQFMREPGTIDQVPEPSHVADAEGENLRGGGVPASEGPPVAESSVGQSGSGVDPSRWQEIDTPFLPEGVNVRLDPERFVVGSATADADPMRTLIESGVDPGSIRPLGYSDWLVVEAARSDEAARIRNAVASTGVFTAPVLRDSAGEFLVPTDSVLVRFEPAIPAEARRAVLVGELGEAITSITAAESMPSLMIVRLAASEGESAMNAANRLSLRDGITIAEPDFVIFGNRVSSGTATAVDVELTAPKTLGPATSIAPVPGVNVVILDDGIPLSPQCPAGHTVFGTRAAVGQPESGADVFGASLVSGLSHPVDRSTNASIRVWASLNAKGRSVTKTLALIEALSIARDLAPRVVASSVASGYRSTLLDGMESELASVGVNLMLLSARDFASEGDDSVSIGTRRIPQPIIDRRASDVPPHDGTPGLSPIEAARRVGRIAGVMLVLGQSGRHPPLRLQKATLEVLDSVEGRGILATDAVASLVPRIARVADRLSIDFDSDGRVSAADTAMFLRLFAHGDPSTDVDMSGRVSQDDLAEFIRRFESCQDN